LTHRYLLGDSRFSAAQHSSCGSQGSWPPAPAHQQSLRPPAPQAPALCTAHALCTCLCTAHASQTCPPALPMPPCNCPCPSALRLCTAQPSDCPCSRPAPCLVHLFPDQTHVSVTCSSRPAPCSSACLCTAHASDSVLCIGSRCSDMLLPAPASVLPMPLHLLLCTCSLHSSMSSDLLHALCMLSALCPCSAPCCPLCTAPCLRPVPRPSMFSVTCLCNRPMFSAPASACPVTAHAS
jgi:hypothetical protein